MTLKLYFDLLSQPSRAVYIFLKLNKIPFEPCQVALRKREHLTEEFKTNLNRFQKVPFIHDGDFKLAESIAIIRYLSGQYNVNNNWYPKDTKAQARVDEYLEWQHTNTRHFCRTFVRTKWLIPLVTGQAADPEELKRAENDVGPCLDNVENIWLANTPYLCGDKISVADVFGACEIEHLRIAGYDPTVGRPVLSAWLQQVKKDCGPLYDEAHVVVNELASKAAKSL